jgi:hypothetical protein
MDEERSRQRQAIDVEDVDEAQYYENNQFEDGHDMEGQEQFDPNQV